MHWSIEHKISTGFGLALLIVSVVGLVSYRHLLRFLAKGMLEGRTKPVAVREVMQDHVLTVEPDTPTLDAIRMMREQKIGCLPVVKDGHLVGVLMERDYMDIAAELLEQNLSGGTAALDSGQ